MTRKNYEQYTTVSYEGRTLLKNHSLSETGLWEVLGEDPNCDFSGSHHQPHLGVFEGTLDDVIRMAVELPRFWQWGAGGSIRKINPIKADSTTAIRVNEIRDQLAFLKEEIKKLETELVALGVK